MVPGEAARSAHMETQQLRQGTEAYRSEMRPAEIQGPRGSGGRLGFRRGTGAEGLRLWAVAAGRRKQALQGGAAPATSKRSATCNLHVCVHSTTEMTGRRSASAGPRPGSWEQTRLAGAGLGEQHDNQSRAHAPSSESARPSVTFQHASAAAPPENVFKPSHAATATGRRALCCRSAQFILQRGSGAGTGAHAHVGSLRTGGLRGLAL